MNRFFLIAISFIFIIQISNAQIDWEPVNVPEGGAFYSLCGNDDFVFAADENYVYRSGDGHSWEKMPFKGYYPLACDNNTVAGISNNYTNNPQLEKYFMVSHDNGVSWMAGALPPTSRGSYVGDIAVCSHGIYVPDGYSESIFKTTDDGLTWDSFPAPGLYCYDLWAFEDKIYAEWSGAFWRLGDDGFSWEEVSPDFSVSEYPVSMYAQDSILFFSTNTTLYYSNDSGQTWDNTPTQVTLGANNFVAIGDRIYRKRKNAGMLYTEDGGQSWTTILQGESTSQLFDLAAVNGELLVGSANRGMLRYDENANKLVDANSGLFSGIVVAMGKSDQKIWTAGGDGVFSYDTQTQAWAKANTLSQNRDHYLAASDGGHVASSESYSQGIFLTNDNGTTWDTIQSIGVGQNFGSFGIRWAGDNLFLYNKYGTGYRSTNFGQNFTSASFPNQIIKFQNNHYGFNDNIELVYSKDNGLNWELVQTDLNRIWRLHACDDRIMAWVDNSIVGRGLEFYVSEDGINWDFANDGIPAPVSFPDVNYTTNNDGLWHVGNKYFLFHQPYFFVSLDTCKTWLPLTNEKFNTMLLIDSVFYEGTKGVYKTVIPQNYGGLASGLVYRDDNNNGQWDAGESTIPGVKITNKEAGNSIAYWHTISTGNGGYAIGISPGSTDTIRAILNNQYVGQINPSHYVVDSNADSLNFGIYFTEDIADVAISAYNARMRPGFSSSMWLNFRNVGTLPATGSVGVKLPTGVAFESSRPAPSGMVGADSIYWDIAQLSVFQADQIELTIIPDTSLPIGNMLEFRGSINTAAQDANTVDNYFTREEILVGSFDPNDKQVSPSRGLTADEVAEGKELLYTINFQNTGTYLAERVRITDVLDTTLNLETLRFVAASHQVTEFRLLPGGLLEIVFDNISLPDSISDEAGSHGFVTFAIQRKKVYPTNGFRIRNKAAIYFDFNNPVITNTVETLLYTPSVHTVEPIEEKVIRSLQIRPNPASESCIVSSQGILSGSGVLKITDASGKLFFQKYLTDASLEQILSLDRFTTGMYIVTIQSEQGLVSGKLLVAKK